MRITDYIKYYLPIISLNIFYYLLLLVVLILDNKFIGLAFSIIFVILITNAMYLLYIFYKHKKFYNMLTKYADSLKDKSQIGWVLEKNYTLEHGLITDILKKISKSTSDKLSDYENQIIDNERYTNLWLHEIKTPLSVIELLNDNDIIEDEVLRINAHIDNILYYSRINNISIDYNITEISIDTLVKNVIKNNQNLLIHNNVSIDLNLLDISVYCDIKWSEFIIKQIVHNSIKYKKNTLEISFVATKKTNGVLLEIKDNGVGIDSKDINFVFDKFYTGENGRLYDKSTGMGLAMVKEACNSMHLDVSINSVKGEFTCVSILFPFDKELHYKSN